MCCIAFSLFIAVLVLHVSCLDPSLRIIGGSDVGEDELPYVASLRLYLKPEGEINFKAELHACSCAILTPTWTLTAAHCVSTNATGSTTIGTKIIKYEFKILYGPITNKTTSKIVKLLKHPAFKASENPPIGFNDIALIKTEEIILRQYGHVGAMDYRSLIGLEATMVGYGLMNVSGEIDVPTDLGKPLQKLETVVIKCSPGYGTLRPILCITRRCDAPSKVCPGDSGGPLLHSSSIIAVATAAPSTACTEKTLLRPNVVNAD
ncbi:hypothetical protein HF086_012134 [Spodoptera exigua]|uniref:Peptidase S1 domain-containing protein n=1 Tax=Spodoptera exigua TaxID=7107 RepID=A0A922SHG0_SPOEX|nr:hypothetical protein HF086_012134 [Spodoptera exigua]